MTTSLYFTRLSVEEEKCFFPPRSLFIPMVKRAINEIPAARAIADAYRRIDGVELTKLFTVDTTKLEPHLPKRYQTGLYACAALALAGELESPVSAAGFYSGGSTAAYLFAGVFDPDTYLDKIFPFNMAVRADMAAKGANRNLAQVLLRVEVGADLESVADQLVAHPPFIDRVFVKDRRQPHAVLMAGYRDDLLAAVEVLGSTFPELKGAKLFPHRFAAHLPFLDHGRLGAMLREEWFNPPICDIIGTWHESVATGSHDRATLKEIFVDGCVGPMNTGSTILELTRRTDEIYVIGSRHGARVLEPFDREVKSILRLPPDELAQSQGVGPLLPSENPELEIMQAG